MAGIAIYTYFFVLCEEFLTLTLLGGLFFLEEGIVNLGGINASNVNLSAGAEGVDLVDSSEGDTVDLEWTCHEEES